MSTAPPATRRHSGDALRRTIYLSSTFADLAKPRAAVAKAVERLQGHTVVGMESYLASDQRPVDRCLSDVAMCDYYLGIFAWRCGYAPAGGDQSITELELREAMRSNKPRLIFVLNEKAAWPAALRDADTARIAALRTELLQTHLVSVFRTGGELPLLASIAVANQTMQELRGVRDVAHQELRNGVAHLCKVLRFLAWLPVTTHLGLKAQRPAYLAGLGPGTQLDLRDPRVVEALRTTSISPPRALNNPYADPVPFGTDRRMVDSIVAEEARAGAELLRVAGAQYSAAELGVDALHATEAVLRHAFLHHLEQIAVTARNRRFMEDSETLSVPIVDSGISGGSVADYLGFVDALDALGRAIWPPPGRGA